MTTEGPEWVTLREAADLTGKAVKTVRRWATEKKLTARKDASGRWLLRRGDLVDREPAAERAAELAILTDELHQTRELFHSLAEQLADARERAGRAEMEAEMLRARLDEELTPPRRWWRKSRPPGEGRDGIEA